MDSFIVAFIIILFDCIIVKRIEKIFPQFNSRHKKGIRKAFIIQATVSVAIVIIGHILQRQVSNYRLFAYYYYLFGFVAIIYISKAFYMFFLIVDWFFSTIKLKPVRFLKPDRFHKSRHIVAKGGLWISLVFAILSIWGILFGRFNFSVERVDVTIDNLPSTFNGYKIVQISDIHAGSFFGFTERCQKAVDLINRQEPDLIVFTGDMVNNFAEELTPLIPIFSQLKAHDGKYAVLGNHDYGGYHDWETPTDSVVNYETFENAMKQMEFVLLKNQSVVIDPAILPSYDCMALIGIENWGIQKHHPKRADLKQAMESVHNIPFKVLLSHDPVFWAHYVKGKTDIALTLSGHTHGMQMGVKLGKKRYTPSFLLHHRYPYGAGLYRFDKQYLYVNRGLGVIGLPARIGMPPEITVITLRKEK